LLQAWGQSVRPLFAAISKEWANADLAFSDIGMQNLHASLPRPDLLASTPQDYAEAMRWYATQKGPLPTSIRGSILG
jgi:hypothetical protein